MFKVAEICEEMDYTELFNTEKYDFAIAPSELRGIALNKPEFEGGYYGI